MILEQAFCPKYFERNRWSFHTNNVAQSLIWVSQNLVWIFQERSEPFRKELRAYCSRFEWKVHFVVLVLERKASCGLLDDTSGYEYVSVFHCLKQSDTDSIA